jgi:hypothetical protein
MLANLFLHRAFDACGPGTAAGAAQMVGMAG